MNKKQIQGLTKDFRVDPGRRVRFLDCFLFVSFYFPWIEIYPLSDVWVFKYIAAVTNGSFTPGGALNGVTLWLHFQKIRKKEWPWICVFQIDLLLSLALWHFDNERRQNDFFEVTWYLENCFTFRLDFEIIVGELFDYQGWTNITFWICPKSSEHAFEGWLYLRFSRNFNAYQKLPHYSYGNPLCISPWCVDLEAEQDTSVCFTPWHLISSPLSETCTSDHLSLEDILRCVKKTQHSFVQFAPLLHVEKGARYL